ncbi:MAG: hypothetical protein JWM20_275 [Patescibacteria group bacterium]|nr:hypothetical protein [Patescibacteria group bacterium]
MIVNKDNQLEIPKYLEDVPDYGKKFKAWEYLNDPNRDEITRPYKERFKLPESPDRDWSGAAAANLINKELGFPRATVTESGKLSLANDDERLREYCKDILGIDGQPLISRDVFREAA